MGTYSLNQLLGRKQAIGLYHPSLPVNPVGLYRVKPGTLFGKQTDDNAYAFPTRLDLPVVLPNPSAHRGADMPGGIVPHKQESPLAKPFQPAATRLKECRGQPTHRTTIHKTQPHPVS